MRDWNKLIADENYWMSKHYTRGRRGKQIRAVALHHNAANLSLRGCWSVWQTRQASAHYQVDINGRIGQYVHDWDTAWAVGGGRNSDTISIEHANNRLGPDWTISDATLDNGAHLTAAICHAYGLGEPRWMGNVFPHQYFMATGCPGAIAGTQRDAYMNRAKAWYRAMANGQNTLAGNGPAAKPRGENMLMREPDGAIYEVSGGRRTRIGDPDLVQRIVNAGIPLIQVKQWDTCWWIGSEDEVKMARRVRDLKDLLTDQPKMEQSLLETSLLRQIAHKLGITSRK